MSIVLKNDVKFLQSIAEFNTVAQDALAFVAMQMAIEEFTLLGFADFFAIDAAKWINERAAANMARLMGEGNG